MRSEASKRFNESSQNVHKPASPQTVGSPRQCVEEDASPCQVLASAAQISATARHGGYII
jgi:hypothetical protein